jgi:hypothetical protein
MSTVGITFRTTLKKTDAVNVTLRYLMFVMEKLKKI